MKCFPILFLFTIAVTSCCYGQSDSLQHQLYKLEDEIISGNRQALIKMAFYIDNKTFIQEFLGYHNYPSSARRIAIRVLSENCLFEKNEFSFDTAISTKKFLDFVTVNDVKYDPLTRMFLLTDASKRTTLYELKNLSTNDLLRIDSTVIKPPFPAWYYENQIDRFLQNKDSQALLWIASAWYSTRARFNRYYFHDEEFLDLMKKLTQLDLGVPDQYGDIDFLYKADYSAVSKLNYLIYWASHYKDYKWDDARGAFLNTTESATEKTVEEQLFSLLPSENDSMAINAFVRLTESDTGIVRKLATQYQANDIDGNDHLPIFPYSFLKQMVLFTQYCRTHGIAYKPEGWLADSLIRLKMNLKFADRYRLENNIVHRLMPEQTGMVEYFGLLNEHEWDATYSVGRILDKFYSIKWNDLTSNRDQLAFYLKKSLLFDNLGIIGNCNKYLCKFENCSSEVLSNIKELSSSNDPDIRLEAGKVISLYSTPAHAPKPGKKTWDGNNSDYGVTNLTTKYHSLIGSINKESDRDYALKKLLGSISYAQIGEAIQLIEKDSSFEKDGGFDFLATDFGIDLDSLESTGIEGFIKSYHSINEKELYTFYARGSGTNCIDTAGELIYAAIYDLLKYGVVDAFVGGGGGRRDQGVYLAIKLLEFKFNSTLGFPKKKCSSQGIYSCDCTDQALAWMQFFEKRKFIDKTDYGPVSMSTHK